MPTGPGFFFGGHMESTQLSSGQLANRHKRKPFLSIDKQIEKLIQRGLLISDTDKARSILLYGNYYNIVNGTQSICCSTESSEYPKYKPNCSIEVLHSLSQFDHELRIMLLDRILRIERRIKSVVAYEFSKHYKRSKKPYAYKRNYVETSDMSPANKRRAEKEIKAIRAKIRKVLTSLSAEKAYLNHYKENYGYVPFWVLINALDLGDVNRVFLYSKQEVQNEIAKAFGIQNHHLKSLMNMIRLYRNSCAHGESLICAPINNTIPRLGIHDFLRIPYDSGCKGVFSLLVCILYLIDETERKDIVKELQDLFFRLGETIPSEFLNRTLYILGFHEGWQAVNDYFTGKCI